MLGSKIGIEEAKRRIRIFPRLYKEKKVCSVNKERVQERVVSVAEVRGIEVDGEAKGMSEAEKRIAERLEEIQEGTLGTLDVMEEQANATEPYDDFKEGEKKKEKKRRRGGKKRRQE